ncbi:MAG: NUDIX domain-containing protein [Patescibacteria group bacterium]
MKKGIDYIGVGVGALIFNDKGKFLVALRGPKAKNEQGKWEIPGGGVEFGETLAEAITREAKEELGVEIKVLQLLQVADHILPDEKQHWVSPTFFCRIIQGEPRVMEPEKCERIGWFTIEEASQLPLSIVTLQDIAVLKKLGMQRIDKIIRGVDNIELPFA